MMNIFKSHKHSSGITQPNTTPVGAGLSMGKVTPVNNGTNSAGPGGPTTAAYVSGSINGTFGAQFASRLTSIMTFTDQKGNEIVRVEPDGSVVWAAGYKIDDAARAFGNSLFLGAERAALVTEGTKKRMRDAVFEELIAIINEEGGSITADELTRYWQAAKIIDKLKGDRE